MSPATWPRRVHSGPYPHTPGCQGCRTRDVCNACGRGIRRDACTLGRCTRCHLGCCVIYVVSASALGGHDAGTFERAVQWITSKPMEVAR